MSRREEFSKTMRIDLIPEIPDRESPPGDRVVIRTPARRMESAPKANGLVAHGPYRDLLQSIYDAALIVDEGGAIKDFNQRALDYFLYRPEVLRGLTIFDVISGADSSLMQSLREHLLSERYALIQAYCLRQDASLFPSEIAVSQIGNEHGSQLCFFVRDVTLRRQTEEMLWTEHNAIQNCGSGIAVADLDAKLEYANQSVAQMWGFGSGEELVGRDVRSLMGDPVLAEEMLSTVLVAQRSWVGHMCAKRSDGSDFHVQVSAACNRLSEGELVGIVLSFVDTSDRMRAEEALRRAETQRVMLESLGAACHHLGQPATVLLGNIELIQAKLQADAVNSKDLIPLAVTSLQAAHQISEILHRLNSVNEYKTTTYAEVDDAVDGPSSRILDI